MMKEAVFSVVMLLVFCVVAVAVVIPQVFTATANINTSPAPTGWWDGNYTCREVLTFNNPTLSPLDQQNIYTIGHRAGMKNNFGDMRFVWKNPTSGLTEEVRYWVENYTSGTLAHVWLYFPVLPPDDTNVSLYYCNPAATSHSDGNAVFPFFDDFSGTSINFTKWTVYSDPFSDCAVSGGLLYSPNDNFSNCFLTSSYDAQVHYDIITATTAGDDFTFAEFYQRYDGGAPFSETSTSFNMDNWGGARTDYLWNNSGGFHDLMMDRSIGSSGYHRWYMRAYGDDFNVSEGFSMNPYLYGNDTGNYNKSSAIWLSGCWGSPP